jgi:hypothetical protein
VRRCIARELAYHTGATRIDLDWVVARQPCRARTGSGSLRKRTLCLTQPHAARLAWTSVRTLCNHSPTHPPTHSPSNPHPCYAAGLVLPYLCRVLTHSLTHRPTPNHADAVGLVLPHLSRALTPRLMHTTTVNIATPFVACLRSAVKLQPCTCRSTFIFCVLRAARSRHVARMSQCSRDHSLAPAIRPAIDTSTNVMHRALHSAAVFTRMSCTALFTLLQS